MGGRYAKLKRQLTEKLQALSYNAVAGHTIAQELDRLKMEVDAETSEDEQRIVEEFAKLDTNGDGEIDRNDIKKLSEALGARVTMTCNTKFHGRIH